MARVCKRPAAEHAGPSTKSMIKVVRRRKEGNEEAYIMKEGKYALVLQLQQCAKYLEHRERLAELMKKGRIQTKDETCAILRTWD